MKLRVQLLFIVAYLILLGYYRIVYNEKNTCIVFENTRACFSFGQSNSLSKGFKNFKFIDYKLTKKTSLISSNLDHDLQKAFLAKDSNAGFEIYLDQSSYGQFISILNRCLKNMVKQVLLDEKANILYIYPDNIAKPNINKDFNACYFTINSNTIDFKLPERK